VFSTDVIRLVRSARVFKVSSGKLLAEVSLSLSFFLPNIEEDLSFLCVEVGVVDLGVLLLEPETGADFEEDSLGTFVLIFKSWFFFFLLDEGDSVLTKIDG